jgi:hypothetical protein
VACSGLPPADLPLVYTTALLFIGFPITVALRCHREGLAALEHRTPTILAGDFRLHRRAGRGGLGLPGPEGARQRHRPLVVASSNLASLGMLVLLLREKGTDVEPPVAPPVASQEGYEGGSVRDSVG